MNKSIYIFALLFTASIFFISCDSEAPHVSVTGISLNETQLTMTVGDPVVALIATVYPSDATNPRVRWESDDTDVAIVGMSGVVIAVSAGTATITATTADGNFSATCEVTVTPVPILVTGVTLENCNAATPLVVGSTRQLSATVVPVNATNRTVVWESSDNDIATVSDNGLVTAVAAGRVTITATTECGSHTATCVITVIPPIPVTGITITGRSSIHLAIGAIDRFSFFITPYATNQAVTWSSDAPAIATVDAVNGTITALSEGDTVITVTTQCGLYTATGLVSVTGEVSICSDGYVQINNINWATRNLEPGMFAQNPYSAGIFFSGWSDESDDPCPEGWRAPTPGQFQRLINEASLGWISYNGVNGRLFGTPGNPMFGIPPSAQLFLPAAGFRNTDDNIWDIGDIGYYWSYCPIEEVAEHFLRFDSRSSYVTRTAGAFGFSVRCVRI